MEVLYDNVYESYFSDGSGKVTWDWIVRPKK
jgi:hypothetical protein